MRKVLLFTLAGCVIVTLAWLLAGVTGHVAVSIGSVSFDTSTSFAILVLIVFVVAILILVRVLRAVLAIPSNSLRWRRRRRLSLGNRSINRVLTALAAGEQGTARKEAHRARNLLGDSPQTLLLVAEAARLSGQEDEAEQAFQALAKQKDGRFLGLRGLLRQAVDRRDWPRAVAIAKQAEAAHPGAVWLRQQRAELALQTDNWAEALELVGSDARRATYYVAAANAETDPKRALGFAKQAWKQNPAFVPAALAYATRLREAGYEKRAQSCVFDAWQRSPHPDLAAFALANESEKLSRANIAQRLTARNPEHPESRLLLAQVALDAGMINEARRQIEVAEADGINQRRLCLLLADIEEQERGDTEAGRMAQRDALRRAATAEPGPHWQCTHCRSDQAAWHPKCPSCSSIGTIQWMSGERSYGVPALAGSLLADDGFSRR